MIFHTELAQTALLPLAYSLRATFILQVIHTERVQEAHVPLALLVQIITLIGLPVTINSILGLRLSLITVS